MFSAVLPFVADVLCFSLPHFILCLFQRYIIIFFAARVVDESRLSLCVSGLFRSGPSFYTIKRGFDGFGLVLSFVPHILSWGSYFYRCIPPLLLLPPPSVSHTQHHTLKLTHTQHHTSRYHTLNITQRTSHTQHHTLDITRLTSHAQHHTLTLNITQLTSHTQHHTTDITHSTSHTQHHTLNITHSNSHTQHHTLDITHSHSHTHIHTPNITH